MCGLESWCIARWSSTSRTHLECITVISQLHNPLQVESDALHKVVEDVPANNILLLLSRFLLKRNMHALWRSRCSAPALLHQSRKKASTTAGGCQWYMWFNATAHARVPSAHAHAPHAPFHHMHMHHVHLSTTPALVASVDIVSRVREPGHAVASDESCLIRWDLPRSHARCSAADVRHRAAKARA
jgi:hypothetical protein